MSNSKENIKLNDNNIENNFHIPENLIKAKKEISMKDKNQNKILDYISVVKIIACFSVIVLHTNHKFWIFQYTFYKKYWISANLIESIFYFAVPFFVLCIGATLLDFNEKYGLKIYFKRRIKKVVLPLFCWNIILYYYYVYIIKVMEKQKITFIYLWNLYFKSDLNFMFSSIRCFLIMYMIIPLIAYVDKSKKIKIYSYCFIILLISQVLIPYLIILFEPQLFWPYRIDVNMIIYIFAGYIIQNYKYSHIMKKIIYILGVFGLVIHIYGTQILTIKYRRISSLHKGYLNFPCIIYSCSSFLFIKENSHFLFKLINRKYINKIGALTLGPFFLHLPIKDAYDKYFQPNHFTLTYRFFGGIVLFIICLILTIIIRQIPFGKYLIP
jgi:surface polysaccharide O-acyltransferase-like enzyme